jgi:hypothetical protein
MGVGIDQAAAPAEQVYDQLVGATFALRQIAEGIENPADCAASALKVIAMLEPSSAPLEPQDDLLDALWPPKALLKREDWDASTRKPKKPVAAPAGAQQADVPTLKDSIAEAFHYPACWDTAAYPTLADALSAVYDRFKCSECAPAAVAAQQAGDEAARDAKDAARYRWLREGRWFQQGPPHERRGPRLSASGCRSSSSMRFTQKRRAGCSVRCTWP